MKVVAAIIVAIILAGCASSSTPARTFLDPVTHETPTEVIVDED